MLMTMCIQRIHFLCVAAFIQQQLYNSTFLRFISKNFDQVVPSGENSPISFHVFATGSKTIVYFVFPLLGISKPHSKLLSLTTLSQQSAPRPSFKYVLNLYWLVP